MTKEKLKCQVFECGNGTYGIRISKGELVFCEYKYFASRLEPLLEFAERINESDLSPIHICDVIEDFLG